MGQSGSLALVSDHSERVRRGEVPTVPVSGTQYPGINPGETDLQSRGLKRRTYRMLRIGIGEGIQARD